MRRERDGLIHGAARALTPADREVLRRERCEDRAPTAADAPRLSVLPMTPAAREALMLNRSKDAA